MSAEFRRVIRTLRKLNEAGELLPTERRDIVGILDCLRTPRPLEEWHEEIGDVLWWRLPVEEPPWCGTPLDSDWTDGYYTHWTPYILPKEPAPLF